MNQIRMKSSENSTIVGAYEVSDTHEISVDYDGFNYLVIFGQHINGGFIAVLSHGICCESSTPDNIFYNTERLISAGMKKRAAQEIAASIAAYAEYRAKEDGKGILC